MADSIRVVLVHRNRLFREGLACALERRSALHVLHAVGDAAELWPRSEELAPHVIVLDLALPQREGLVQARVLRHAFPLAAILMTGLSELESDVLACWEAGATACLAGEASLDDLVAHVQAAAAGEVPCTPRVAALLVARLQQRTRELQHLQTLGPVRLTRRELQIIALIEERLQNKEIATRLGIEVQTVKNHVHNVLEKLELHGRYAAVRYARERGLLPPPRPQARALAHPGEP